MSTKTSGLATPVWSNLRLRWHLQAWLSVNHGEMATLLVAANNKGLLSEDIDSLFGPGMAPMRTPTEALLQ